ncbi:MAG: AsmA family protein [Elusimicrobiota bacterium]
MARKKAKAKSSGKGSWTWTRWIGWTAVGAGAAALALAVAATVAVNVFVTPEALKSRIAGELEKAFNRPVRLDHVTLLLHQGVKVSGLEVQDSEDFGGEVFLSSRFLLAKFKLWPLLFGRVELRRVLLMSPRIQLVRRADGVWNLEDILFRPERPARVKDSPAVPPLHSAEFISIERGELRVRDVPRRLDLSFDGVRFQAKNFSPETPFTVQMTFRNESWVRGKLVRAAVDLKGSVSLGGFRPGEVEVSAKRLAVEVDGLKLEAEGTVRNLLRPVVDITLDLPRLTSAVLSRYHAVPKGIDLPPSRWELRLGPEAPSASASASTGTAPSSPASATGFGAYRVSELSVSAGGMLLEASGRVDLDERGLSLTVRTPKFPLEKAAGVYAPWAQRRMEGTAAGSLKLAGSFAEPEVESVELELRGFSTNLKNGKRIGKADITIRGKDRLRSIDVRVPRGTYVAYGNALSDIDLEFRIEKGDMVVPKLGVTWNESRFRLAGCVKNVAAPKEVYVDGNVDRLRIDEFYAAIENLIILRKAEKGETVTKGLPWARVFKYAIPKRFPDLTGRVRMSRAHSPNFDTQNVEVLWELKDIARGLKNVNGHFRIGFGPGRVMDVPKVRKAHPVVNVLLLPFVEMHKIQRKSDLSLDTAVPKTLDFTRTYGEFGAERGIVDVRYLHFDSGQFVSFTDGRVDFPTEKLDLHVLLRIPEPRGNLSYYLVDTKGRPSIDITIEDDLNRPNVKFKTRKIQADDIENALAAGLQRVLLFPALDEKLSCGRN